MPFWRAHHRPPQGRRRVCKRGVNGGSRTGKCRVRRVRVRGAPQRCERFYIGGGRVPAALAGFDERAADRRQQLVDRAITLRPRRDR